jgi:hypothetical protein
MLRHGGKVISGVRHDGEVGAATRSKYAEPTSVVFRARRRGRRTVEDRHGVSPLAEEASSPYGATNRGGRPAEPGVSWSSLQNLRYQGPEQRSRKLPKPLSRIQHDYGDPAVPIAP